MPGQKRHGGYGDGISGAPDTFPGALESTVKGTYKADTDLSAPFRAFGLHGSGCNDFKTAMDACSAVVSSQPGSCISHSGVIPTNR
jgi:hypothetical protein